MSMMIDDGAVVLFQGDSITDAGRSREDDTQIGYGYAMMTAAWFSALHPDKKVKFLNRGNSGNRAVDLAGRWEQDCLALKPTVVSILIGINDTWRRYDSNDPTTAEAFEKSYRDILRRTREKLDARILLLEPFVLPVPEDRKGWRVDLDPKIDVVRRLAREFGATLVPLDGLFAQASTHQDAAFWTADGVHPTMAGHALITRHWLATVGAM